MFARIAPKSRPGLAALIIAAIFAVVGLYLLLPSDAGPQDPNDPNFPIADLNSDLRVTIVDLSILLNRWQTSDGAADFNDDGSVNIVDLSYLLAQWGREDSPGNGHNPPDLSALNNPGGLFQYNDNANLTAQQVNNIGPGGPYGPFHNSQFTLQTTPAGGHVDGNFRLQCAVSHFAYDDPIIFPNQPGRAHLHMFWGNTQADAFTNFTPGDLQNNLLERGGSTCAGGVLNRSAYWAPAMFAGHGSNRQIVVPKEILLYYKSKRQWEVNPLPAGIQLLVGNVNANGTTNDSFTVRESLHWGCNNGSVATRLTNTIPGTNGTAPCPDNMTIQASIQFPQCIAMENGRPKLRHETDFINHTYILERNGFGQQNDACPSSHPYRVPQISYLIKWDNPPGNQEANWRLSSDRDFDKAFVPHPGGSLHGDWLGGWQDQAIQAWIDGCFQVSNGPGQQGRNCSLGQTGANQAAQGSTQAAFQRIPGSRMDGQKLLYNGPYFFNDPDPTYNHTAH